MELKDRLRDLDLPLAQSEQIYRDFFELSQQIPWVADPEGTILWGGSVGTSLTGIAFGEAVGNGWEAAVHPDDRLRLKEVRSHSFSTGEPYECEYRLRLVDGSYRWFCGRGAPRRDESGRIIRWYGLIQDIHARKQAEQALRESEQRLQVAIEAADLGTFDLDLTDDTAVCSPRHQQMFGYAEPQPQWGTAIAEQHVLEEDKPIFREALQQALETGVLSYEVRVRWPDGSIHWISSSGRTHYDAAGRPIRMSGVVADVTQRKLAEEAALRESEEHHRYSVELNPQISWTADPQGSILDASSRWCDLTGMSLEEALGSGWAKALHPDDLPLTQQRWSDAVANGEAFDAEYRARTADGSYRWFRARAAARRNEQGQIVRWYGTTEDIHDKKLAEEKLRWAAYHDDLTGLANRRLFQEHLQQVLERSTDECGVGLLILDVNDFKLINDRFGHDAGDDLLKEIGQRLCKAVRATDTVARLGGDEFAILLADVGDAEDVEAIARAVQVILDEPLSHSSGLSWFRTSMGGVFSTERSMRPEELLKQGDLALYRCKADKSGTFQMFEPVMRSEAQKTASALEMARKALASDWIVPFYQPKVALGSGAVSGLEALLRWHQPHGGIHVPGTIAPAFEHTDLGVAIGERMLSRVIGDMRGWLDAGLDFGRVAVNASAPEFLRHDYAERVLEHLYQADVPANHLRVEVTEGVLLGRNAGNVERTLRTLSAAGVTVALDDFGTGYASLSHLKQFPVDEIKIDRSFVRDMETDASDAAIVKAILSLGQSLGIQVVAEGVENAVQAELLRRQGCDLAQGYYFGRPIPAEDVPELIGSWRKPWPEETSVDGARGRLRLVRS